MLSVVVPHWAGRRSKRAMEKLLILADQQHHDSNLGCKLFGVVSGSFVGRELETSIHALCLKDVNDVV